MKILVLNCGSSSIKYKLYDMADESVLAQGIVERIGLDEAFIKVKLDNGEKKQIMADLPTHKEGVSLVFNCLLDPEFGAIKSLDDIEAVGHRIVQGGDNAVTDYFAGKTRAPLGQKFQPVVGKALDKLSITTQYNDLTAKASKLGLIQGQAVTVQDHVTQRALDGLYFVIGEEERRIRKDPVGTGSALLKKVFGAL